MQEPVSTSHRPIVLLMLPAAMTLPSAEKATDQTEPLQNRSKKYYSLYRDGFTDRCRLFYRIPVAQNRASGICRVARPITSMRARTIRVAFAAKLLKEFVLHLLTLLTLPSTKSFTGTSRPVPRSLVPKTGLLALKALTHGLQVCACRSPFPHPTDRPCCQSCLRRRPFRRLKRPRN